MADIKLKYTYTTERVINQQEREEIGQQLGLPEGQLPDAQAVLAHEQEFMNTDGPVDLIGNNPDEKTVVEIIP